MALKIPGFGSKSKKDDAQDIAGAPKTQSEDREPENEKASKKKPKKEKAPKEPKPKKEKAKKQPKPKKEKAPKQPKQKKEKPAKNAEKKEKKSFSLPFLKKKNAQNEAEENPAQGDKNAPAPPDGGVVTDESEPEKKLFGLPLKKLIIIGASAVVAIVVVVAGIIVLRTKNQADAEAAPAISETPAASATPSAAPSVSASPSPTPVPEPAEIPGVWIMTSVIMPSGSEVSGKNLTEINGGNIFYTFNEDGTFIQETPDIKLEGAWSATDGIVTLDVMGSKIAMSQLGSTLTDEEKGIKTIFTKADEKQLSELTTPPQPAPIWGTWVMHEVTTPRGQRFRGEQLKKENGTASYLFAPDGMAIQEADGIKNNVSWSQNGDQVTVTDGILSYTYTLYGDTLTNETNGLKVVYKKEVKDNAGNGTSIIPSVQGTWVMTAVTPPRGETLTGDLLLEENGTASYIFEAGGKAIQEADGKTREVKWEQDGATVTVTDGKLTYIYTVSGDQLSNTTNGLKVVYTRQDDPKPQAEPSAEPQEEPSAEPQEEPQAGSTDGAAPEEA